MAVSRRKLALRITAVVIVAVVAVLFTRAIIDGWDRVQQYTLLPDLSWALAWVLFALAVSVSGVLWGRVLRSLSPGIELPVAEAVRSHLAGWVMRYIPGVGSVLYKLGWAQKRGVSKLVALAGFTYESIFLQIASIVGGGTVLIVAVGLDLVASNVAVVIALAAMLVAFVLMVSRPVVRPVLTFVLSRRLKSRVDEVPLLPTWRSLLYAFEFLVPRVINGIGVVLLSASIFAASAPDPWVVAAAYTVAGAIGILAVFVPGGLGVREGAFVGILAAAGVNVVDAVLLAVVARFVSTLSDLLIAGVYGLLTAAGRRKDSSSS